MNRQLKSAYLAAAVLAATGAYAQTYPAKPVRVIIPAPVGGGVDTVGRAVSQKLTEALGQPFVPDNRPGAGTMIGSELTAKSPADGYTVLMMTNSHAINASVQKNLKYDPIRDFSEISLLAISPYLLVVHPTVPAKSVRELVELARKRPGDLHFASAGSASATHLAGELFGYMAKVKLTHVPYKGGAPAVTDLVGGHVQLMFNNLISVMALSKQGRLRALAITSLKRSPLLPDLPTVSEAGVPGYESASWYGAVAPANTPPQIIATLNREMVKAIKSPEISNKLTTEGAQVIGNSPEEFAKYLRADIARWQKLVPAIGLRID
ncbi:MAG TPA: tripartite tricarboxylate transporter substrate binding protein [Burkholderiales bacterium]|nr:tripartite tricarboxylate transporter substrate binding protein [Burkholderiales bacterium]